MVTDVVKTRRKRLLEWMKVVMFWRFCRRLTPVFELDSMLERSRAGAHEFVFFDAYRGQAGAYRRYGRLSNADRGDVLRFD